MKISVCMATYNGDKFIKEQIASILKQIGEMDELIISDDKSKDQTVQIIKDFQDPRIHFFINEGENGYTKNFENAIRHSTGDIIFLSDQDDVWVDDKVEKMLAALANNDLVVSDAQVVDEQLQPLYSSHFALHQVKTGFWHNFTQTRYVGACMAFRREILEKAMPFPKNQKYCAHDYWLANIGEMYYRVALVEEPLILYRRHSSNASTGGEKSKNSLVKKLSVRLYVLYNLLRRR